MTLQETQPSSEDYQTEETSVPCTGDIPSYGAILPVSARDLVHRHEYVKYALEDAQPFHKEQLTKLYDLWGQWNERYYAGALVRPYVTLSEPTKPSIYGQCFLISSWGGKSEIRLRPSLLRGSHPDVRSEEQFAEGRFLFVADVLLHEMIHQYQQEVSGKTEESYHGHGPGFRDIANRIGADLRLFPVRSSKKRGKDVDLPSCSQWPHCVRPLDYYQGAYVVPGTGDITQAPLPPPEPTFPLFSVLLAVAAIREAQEVLGQHLSGVKSAKKQAPLLEMRAHLQNACVLLGAQDEEDAA